MSALKQALIQKSSPTLAARIPQQNSGTLRVRQACDGVPICVAESVPDALIRHGFSGTLPNVAELIAQSDVIAVTITVDVSAGLQFFKMEKATGNFAVNPLAFIDHTRSMRRSRRNPNGVSALEST